MIPKLYLNPAERDAALYASYGGDPMDMDV